MIYQLRITLMDTNPPIWRRVLIPAKTSLAKVHAVLQATMGWQNGHLHQFRTKTGRLETPIFYAEPDGESSDDVVDERKVKLSDVLKEENDSIYYDYDFGDSWEHDLVLEKIVKGTADQKRSICLEGELNCPPEDIGGIPGFYEFLAALKDPKHESHSFYKNRAVYFVPENFDLNSINKELAAI